MFIYFYIGFLNCREDRKYKIDIFSKQDAMGPDGHFGEESSETDHNHKKIITEPVVEKRSQNPENNTNATPVNIPVVYNPIGTNQNQQPNFVPQVQQSPPPIQQIPIPVQPSLIPIPQTSNMPPKEASNHDIVEDSDNKKNNHKIETIKEIIKSLEEHSKEVEMQPTDELYAEIQKDNSLKIVDNNGRTLSESKNEGRLIWLDQDEGSRFYHPGNDDEPNVIRTTGGECLKRINNGIYVRECPKDKNDKDYMFTLKISKENNEDQKEKKPPKEDFFTEIKSLLNTPKNYHINDKETNDSNVGFSLAVYNEMKNLEESLNDIKDKQKEILETEKSLSHQNNDRDDSKKIENELEEIVNELKKLRNSDITAAKNEEKRKEEEKKNEQKKEEEEQLKKNLETQKEIIERLKKLESSQTQQPLIVPIPTPNQQNDSVNQQKTPNTNKDATNFLSSLISTHPAMRFINSINPNSLFNSG